MKAKLRLVAVFLPILGMPRPAHADPNDGGGTLAFAEAPEKRAGADVPDVVEDEPIDVQKHIVDGDGIALGEQRRGRAVRDVEVMLSARGQRVAARDVRCNHDADGEPRIAIRSALCVYAHSYAGALQCLDRGRQGNPPAQASCHDSKRRPFEDLWSTEGPPAECSDAAT